MSKIVEIEKKLDELLEEAPLDFIGTGDYASARYEEKEWNRKIKEFKEYLREQLGEEEKLICTRYHLG